MCTPADAGAGQEPAISFTQPREPYNPDLVDPFLDAFPVDRVSMLTLGDPFGVEVLCATDSVAAELADLEIDLGEGPSWDAYRSQTPTLVPDLAADMAGLWPVFTQAMSGHHLQAIYAFPLTFGSLRIGAVELSADSTNVLSTNEVVRVTAMVDATASEVLSRALEQIDDEAVGHGVYSRREVHQATGMVIVQARVNAADALLLIRAHAFSSGRSVRDVAADIAARRITLGS